jgi:O-acetyl-ADP-ribose deacetylase (regulator of RNase III)
MSKRELFGDCLFVAPHESGANDEARGILETIIAPAWANAGGVQRPILFNDIAGRDGNALQRLADARVVFVDVTGGQPFALYHLGVRDALARTVTIPLCRGPVPPGGPEDLAARTIALDAPGGTMEQIADRLSRHWRKDDAFQSPVAKAIPGLHVVTRVPRPITGTPTRQLWSIAPLNEQGRPLATPLPTKIGILCGDLRDVRGIDVWVSSENTLMEMGRMGDKGISALIRYLGARGADDANFVDDVIQRELMGAVGGSSRPVREGSVFWTHPGRLDKFGVREIAHVATVKPRDPPGSGFVPVADLPVCVANVLASLEHRSSRFRFRGMFTRSAPIRSILFPLMGTGNAGQEARIVSGALISAAVDRLRQSQPAGLEQVLFLAHTDADRDLCEAALNALDGVTPVTT